MAGAAIPKHQPQAPAAPPPPPLNEWPATEIARGIAAGDFTCEAVVRACLLRIIEREPVLRAWTNFGPERALAEACARDRAIAAPTISQFPHAGHRYGLEIGERSFDPSTSSAYTTKQRPACEVCQGSARQTGHLRAPARKGLGIS